MRDNVKQYYDRAQKIRNDMTVTAGGILVLVIIAVVYFDSMGIWKDLWFIAAFAYGGMYVIDKLD